jgi:hypothetical protein
MTEPTILIVTTPVGVHNIEVRSWEHAVEVTQRFENDRQAIGLEPAQYKILEPENRSWVRTIESDGTVVWLEE